MRTWKEGILFTAFGHYTIHISCMMMKPLCVFADAEDVTCLLLLSELEEEEAGGSALKLSSWPQHPRRAFSLFELIDT
jgi:hypothetical protein